MLSAQPGMRRQCADSPPPAGVRRSASHKVLRAERGRGRGQSPADQANRRIDRSQSVVRLPFRCRLLDVNGSSAQRTFQLKSWQNSWQIRNGPFG